MGITDREPRRARITELSVHSISSNFLIDLTPTILVRTCPVINKTNRLGNADAAVPIMRSSRSHKKVKIIEDDGKLPSRSIASFTVANIRDSENATDDSATTNSATTSPATNASTTKASTTNDSATNNSATNNSATNNSATNNSATNNSATNDSATHDSATNDSATQRAQTEALHDESQEPQAIDCDAIIHAYCVSIEGGTDRSRSLDEQHRESFSNYCKSLDKEYIPELVKTVQATLYLHKIVTPTCTTCGSDECEPLCRATPLYQIKEWTDTIKSTCKHCFVSFKGINADQLLASHRIIHLRGRVW
ncbi:hypothetical protein C7974DRAFT_473971 [Boeremia exigua]|uniref:uncharacterized protein n=1 Tax=Boeremia exigua TaxID=749465 RepID=UPI001E8EC565|nr:uncharacterized protein C7974DRAFT_473971 [Boeremia exigua]KAH6620175.1 hypothetical protein C7974DRAFT_473971 [Boeremia exigua]